MKRGLAATSVVLGVLSVLACSPFSSGTGGAGTDVPTTSSGADAEAADAAPASPDGREFCTSTIACDLFDDAYSATWSTVSGNLYQPTIDKALGRLVCALEASSSDLPTSGDAAQLERTLPINVKMRIELDVTFYAPKLFNGNNIQLLAIYNGGTIDSRTYLGLYVQTPSTDSAALVLTLAHSTGGPTNVGVGSIRYGVPTHIALDVVFGTDSAVLLDSVGATQGKQTFTSTEDTPVKLLLGASRQNGGTDALRAEYDNFRVLPIASF